MGRNLRWIRTGCLAMMPLLGGCYGSGIKDVDIHPPTRGLLHALQQSEMKNVSDHGYKVTPSSDFVSGKDTDIMLHVTDPSGLPVRQFSEDMTKLLHLIVVSEDLSSFSHLHPRYEGDGTFTAKFRFPFGGSFLLISEFMPDRQGLTVYKQWVSVKGEPPAAVQLTADTSFRKTAGNLEVKLSMMPTAKELAAGQMAMLDFRFADARTHKPVHLERYLGTWGHCVILNDKADRYVHVHAAAEMSSEQNAMFHAQFPASGIYKLWVQVQYEGEVAVFPFVLAVK